MNCKILPLRTRPGVGLLIGDWCRQQFEAVVAFHQDGHREPLLGGGFGVRTTLQEQLDAGGIAGREGFEERGGFGSGIWKKTCLAARDRLQTRMKPLVLKRFAYAGSKGVDPVRNNSSTQLGAWIARMNDGDNAAKNELLRYAYERLRCLARKMLRQDFPRLKEWEETDDVLQNAALRLDRALRVVPVASAAEFFRLAATAIRRELLDLARHYQPGREAAAGGAPQLAESSSSPPAAADPSDSTYEPSRLEAWTEFHKQVEALPEEERQVFDLIWYKGQNQIEAASLLGVPRATVQRRWLKARLRLKAILDQKQWGLLIAGKP